MPSQYDSIARCFGPRGRAAYSYVSCKLAWDPVYQATADALKGSDLPLLDLGCGVGLLAAWLRRSGHSIPLHGLDYDDRKVDRARELTRQHPEIFGDCRFDRADLRHDPLPEHSGNITILDILQFFTPAQRQQLLAQAAARVPQGGVLIIRQTLDNARRRLFSRATDRIARLTGWMADHPTAYPSAEEITRTLVAAGLHGNFTHLPGKLPLDNWFGVFRRS